MTASPSDGSDMFMSCAENSGFEASDIPLSQDSEASQSPGILPLLTQGPNQSFSDDDENDEFHSQSPQVETTSANQGVTATPPTDKWIRPDLPPASNDAKKCIDGSPFTKIREEKKLPDTPAAAAGPMEAQVEGDPVNNDILSSSPEGMMHPDESASAGISPTVMSNSFFMTQSPHNNAFSHQAESSDGFNGEMDDGEPLSSQPSPTFKALSSQPTPTIKATIPRQGSNETVDVDMDSGEPLPSQPGSANKATTPLPRSAPSSQYDDGDSSSNELSSPGNSRASTPSNEQPKDPPGATFLERRQMRVDRNKQILASLGLGSAKKAQTPIGTIASPDEKYDAPTPLPTGMLFPLPCNESSMTNKEKLSGDPACSVQDTGAEVDKLYERYPHREFQIKTLVSLVGTAMGQTVCQGNVPYVPPPIFVSGPSGTGKTVVVRDVVDTLQRYHMSQLDASERRVIGTAYVNCAAVEPSSLEAVLESAYNQLAPPVVSGRRARHSKRPKKKLKRKKDAACDLPEVKQLKAEGEGDAFELTLPSEDGDMCIQPNNDDVYNSDDEAELEDKIEAFKTQLSHEEVDEKKDADSTANPPSRRKTRHSMNGAVGRKRQAPSRGVPNAREKTIRKVESVAKSHGAPVAFGRVLAPLFGLPSPLTPEKKPGSAFLILDHAERLFTLSANQKAESNNFLAQLLLLPQVMGLNLTLIIVSRSTLLDCSRINNSASVQKSLGTISNGVRPARVHFPAYKGKGMFKTILKQPNIVELIVGRQNHLFEAKQKDPRHKFQQSTIDSFVETVVQSLSSVTRDIREMIRTGRALWATYILPLEPRNLRTTLEAARRRRNKRLEQTESARDDNAIEDIEELQKELLAILDEAILPRMKRYLEDDLFMLKGDDTHPDLSAGSAVAPRVSSCQCDLPYLSKCLLLAAFVCQSNKPDKDKALFTIQKNGKKNNRQGHRVGNNDADGLAYGSTTWEQQRLKMLRPRSFPLERMLSVFVSIIGLIGGEEKLRLSTNSTADPRELLRAIGSTCFFENLARLREIGLLHEVQGSSTGGGDGFASFDGINMMSTKYWCELNRDDAEAFAASVDFPLENFLL